MVDHKKDIKTLKQGFHKMISDLNHQKFNEFMIDLDKRIDTRLSSFDTASPQQDKKLLERISFLEKKIQRLENHKSVKVTTSDNRLAAKVNDLNRKISYLEKELNKPLPEPESINDLFSNIRSVEKKLSRIQETIKKPEKKKESLTSIYNKIDSLEKKLSAVEKHANRPFPKSPSFEPLYDEIGGLSKKISGIEKQAKGLISKPKSSDLNLIFEKIELLDNELSTLKKGISSNKKIIVKEHEERLPLKIKSLKEKLSVIDSDTAKVSDIKIINNETRRLRNKISLIESELKKPLPEPTSLSPVYNKINSLDKKLTSIEKESKRLISKSSPPDLNLVFEKIDALDYNLSTLKRATQKNSDLIKKEHREFIPTKIDSLNKKIKALDSELRKPIPLPNIPKLEPVYKKIKALDNKILLVKKQASTPFPKIPSNEPLIRRIKSLEKRLSGLNNKAEKTELRSFRTESKLLRTKLSRLEDEYLLLSRDIKKMVPTKKLSDLETKLKPPKQRNYEPLLRNIEDKRLSSERELSRKIHNLESQMQSTIDSVAKKMESAKIDINHKLDQKESELMNIISKGDFAINKKLNSQFLTWLSNLETSVKNKIDENLEDLERLRKEMNNIKKDFAKKDDLEDLEENLISPISKLDKNIKKFVKSEISRLETGLRKAQKIESIDNKTVQKEIERIVKELERQRTKTLEEEIGVMLEEGERLKKNRMKI